MFIVQESTQNRLKPHWGGMVASGVVHAAPMELERILGCGVTINMSLPTELGMAWPTLELESSTAQPGESSGRRDYVSREFRAPWAGRH